MTRPRIVLVAAVALVLGACGSADDTTTGTTSPPPGGTGVHGRVTAGPTCPVERPGQPCPPDPVAGRVEAVDAEGRTAASDTTDAAGRYTLALDPGAYTLRVATGALFPVCPDTDVSVPAGPAVTVDISCDTGIR